MSTQRPPTRSRRGITMFALSVLLLGAVTTIAVAWGCRWVTDEQRRTELDAYRALGPNYGDAHPEWGNPYALSLEADVGADGRRLISNRVPSAAFDAARDLKGRSSYVIDVGVHWVAALTPACHAAYRPVDFEPWGEARVTIPLVRHDSPRRDVVPWWSSVDTCALPEDGGVINVGAGWPLPAFIATHRLPGGPYAMHPLRRETEGVLIGHPFGRGDSVQLPYRPFALGFVVNTTVMAGVWSVVLLGAARLAGGTRRWWRRRRARCVHCGHRRSEGGGTACPECGRDDAEWHVAWRACSRMAVAATLLLVIAEIALAIEVRTTPEITPLMRAVADGDRAAVQRLAADPQVSFDLELPSPYVATRGYGPSDFAPPRLGDRTAGLAAIAVWSDQFDVLPLILERRGRTLPADSDAIDLALNNDLIFALRFGSPAFVERTLNTWGWFIESSRVDGEIVRTPFLWDARAPMPEGWFELAVAHMESDAEYHEHAWVSLVECARSQSALEPFVLLARIGPGAPIADQEWTFLSYAVQSLLYADAIWPYPRIDLAPFRLWIAVEFARRAEAATPVVDGRRMTVVNPRWMAELFSPPRTRAKQDDIWFMQHVDLSVRTPDDGTAVFWFTLDEIDPTFEFPAEFFVATWHELARQTDSMDVDPPLDPWLESTDRPLAMAARNDHATTIVTLLLDHGAAVTDVTMDVATEQNGAVIDAWLLAHEQPVFIDAERTAYWLDWEDISDE